MPPAVTVCHHIWTKLRLRPNPPPFLFSPYALMTLLKKRACKVLEKLKKKTLNIPLINKYAEKFNEYVGNLRTYGGESTESFYTESF